MATARRAPASSGTGPAAVPSEAIIQAELVRAEPVPPADERLPGSDVPAEPIGPERIRPGTAPSQPAQPPRSPAPPPARPAAPAAQRVRRFVEGQRQAAEEAAQAQAAPKPPSPPRRAVGEILAAFMEEKHIRWGELVGGLLIVSCSAALVISFWSTIAERPWLQFGVFNGVTAALFGIGLHAARRWRLPTTSQGVLLIAMLLVPLNFLAIAAFSEGAAPANLLALTGEIVSIAAFTALAYFAAKILVPQATLPLVLVVIAQSILELLMRRLVGPESGLSVLYLVSLLSLGIYAGVNLWGQWQLVGTEPISESRANEIFKLLGVSSFATLLAVGLMVFKVGDVPLIRQLAPLAALAAIPALSLGVTLWRRVEPALGGIQTAGISIAVGGVVILLAGLSLAWPQPCTLLPAAALTGVILILLATWHSIPETHLVAAFCLLIAYTLSFHVLTGKLAWQVDGIPRSDLGRAFRCDRQRADRTGGSDGTRDGRVGLVGSPAGRPVLGLRPVGWRSLSLALIVFYGFGSAGDPHGATWSLALYTLLFFATAVGLRQVAVTWLTVALALLTCIQAVVYRYGEFFGWQDPWTVAYLAHATLMTLSAICGRLGWPQLFPLDSLPAEADGAKHQSPAAWDAASLWKTDPWSAACLLISIGAVAWLPLRAMGSGAAIPATFITWAGVLWLVIAWLQRTPYLYAAFQAAMTVGAGPGRGPEAAHSRVVLGGRDWLVPPLGVAGGGDRAGAVGHGVDRRSLAGAAGAGGVTAGGVTGRERSELARYGSPAAASGLAHGGSLRHGGGRGVVGVPGRLRRSAGDCPGTVAANDGSSAVGHPAGAPGVGLSAGGAAARAGEGSRLLAAVDRRPGAVGHGAGRTPQLVASGRPGHQSVGCRPAAGRAV